MKYPDLFSRLIANTEEVIVNPKLGPCYQWTAACGRDGYSKVSVREDGKVKKKKGHRLMVEVMRGRKVRKDMHVDHKCVNRKCIRFEHLKVCTPKTNMQLREKRRNATRKTTARQAKPNASNRVREARRELVLQD